MVGVVSPEGSFVDLATITGVSLVVDTHEARIRGRRRRHTIGKIDGFLLAYYMMETPLARDPPEPKK